MARPLKTFEGFIGQRNAVNFVQKMIRGARQNVKPLPALLLIGPSGIGKTSFAEATASAYGTAYRYKVADSRMRSADLYVELRALNFADVFCIDEAHRLSRDSQESMYRAMDEHMIPAEMRDGQGRRIEESIAEFCLVLATNYPGEIQKALRNRTTPIAFEAYTMRELVEIGKRVAAKLELNVTTQALDLIADASQGSPRNVDRRLKSLELFAPDIAKYNLNDVRDLLTAEGFDHRNLMPPQRAYLRCVAGVPKQRAMLDHISARLGVDTRFIRQEIEPYLIESGYIVLLSNNARELTDGGRELLRELKAEDCTV